jgi:YopX protein
MDPAVYSARKLKFKAWNTESRLLMRLNAIECVRGELFKKDHILLQFTGLFDDQGEEVYDMDVLLGDSRKYVVRWEDGLNGWKLTMLESPAADALPLVRVKEMRRLCSWFESEK